jgi:predicted lipid-binding transport protein (Tim44 family)
MVGEVGKCLGDQMFDVMFGASLMQRGIAIAVFMVLIIAVAVGVAYFGDKKQKERSQAGYEIAPAKSSKKTRVKKDKKDKKAKTSADDAFSVTDVASVHNIARLSASDEVIESDTTVKPKLAEEASTTATPFGGEGSLPDNSTEETSW